MNKLCQKCGDALTGHEDDSGTHCRWCVTCGDPETITQDEAQTLISNFDLEGWNAGGENIA